MPTFLPSSRSIISLAPDASAPLSQTPFLEGARKEERARVAKVLCAHYCTEIRNSSNIQSKTLKALCGVPLKYCEGYLKGGQARTGSSSEQDFLTFDLALILSRDMIYSVSKGGTLQRLRSEDRKPRPRWDGTLKGK